MFREEYIKDNELIKPDDDFLKCLKESVTQEEDVHIGDYVDYDNVENFDKIGGDDNTVVEMSSGKKGRFSWKTFATIAACFILVCAVVFTVGRTGIIDEEGIQAGVESVLSDTMFTTEDSMDSLNEECVKVYDKVYDLFQTDNVRIYEIESYEQNDSGIEYLQGSTNQYRELNIKERDELVSNILEEQYTLTDTTEEFDSAIYYMAEFDNQTCVVFAIDLNQFIYVVEVSGIQNMAWR